MVPLVLFLKRPDFVGGGWPAGHLGHSYEVPDDALLGEPPVSLCARFARRPRRLRVRIGHPDAVASCQLQHDRAQPDAPFSDGSQLDLGSPPLVRR